MLPGALRKRVEFLEIHKEGEIVFGYTQSVIGGASKIRADVAGRPNPESIFVKSLRSYIKKVSNLSPLRDFLNRFQKIDYSMMKQLVWARLIPLQDLLIDKKVIQRAGLFNVDFTTIDDMEYKFRLARLAPFYFIPAPTRVYRLHGRNKSLHTPVRVLEEEWSKIKKRHGIRTVRK